MDKNDKNTGNDRPEFSLSHTLIEGHAPQDKEVKFSIGPYKIIELIGKGGMGEVFHAYDTICGRKIALKRVRPDLLDFTQINNRFLKEAHVTSQLTHPSIIPIYSIHKEGPEIYYTMPFVQGETLKQILKNIRKLTKKGKKADQFGGSIPSLIRIFTNVCHAIAYSHSKNVLHRDLKPENIIVGQFGEVLILDWGLAKLLRPEESQNIPKDTKDSLPDPKTKTRLSGITGVGKVVGTVSYMAPERALGNTSTFRTDIYSLGVILYQMLTLRYPFIRGTLDEFRKKIDDEILIDPCEAAPYRDIPKKLAQITMKCLDPDPEKRYASVDELVSDIEDYTEGKAEWFKIATLDPKNKSDWEFQENIYLQEHLAITRSSDMSDWMSLMISKASFSENVMLEATLRIRDGGHGLGFLFSIPETLERKHLNDGYCLWISSEDYRSTKLMRSTIEVIFTPEVALKYNESYDIRIDKVDNIIRFYLNNKLQFSYISHLPLVGTHVGLIARDFDFEIENFHIYTGSQNVTVKCLAVPDAFLAHKLYQIALSEYRRIGYSFPGRAEGREALFRAGITLLEEAKNKPDSPETQHKYEEALKEFEKLYKTPGAPLEYLGKALVYQALRQYDEEIKCFELGCRRYPKHPLLPILQEQIIFRMHECSRIHRKATYQFILLTTRLFKDMPLSRHVKKLFESLQKHWEPLPFIEDPEETESASLNRALFSLKLAFWLGKPYSIEEIISDALNEENPSANLITNALVCLIKLGSIAMAQKWIGTIIQRENPLFSPQNFLIEDLIEMIRADESPNDESVDRYLDNKITLTFSNERTLLHICDRAFVAGNPDIIHHIYAKTRNKFSSKNSLYLDAYEIQAYFLEQRWQEGALLLMKYPIEALSQETSILHTLYGCRLLMTEGKDISQIHFSGVLESSFPRSWTLLSHYLNKRDNDFWITKAFPWEKRELYKQLRLYYICLENKEASHKYSLLEKEEAIDLF